VSSIIRAVQIAEYLGAKLNPLSGYQDDICIYVKPHVHPDQDFQFEGRPYLDIIDGYALIPLLQRHPEVPVIACSQTDFDRLTQGLSNKIVFIPQHHCNFERVTRKRHDITMVGVIGTPGAFPFLPPELKSELAKRGIQLWEYSHFISREDIINFYLNIDIQIVWRPYHIKMANPLKLVNAASFGIPTIALEESYFKEMEGCYIPVNNLKEFLIELDKLKANPKLYEKYANKCLAKAEVYHIQNIARQYQKLS
jgi:glycosyltransferase involved in cell wall biosynthesis